MNSEMKFSHTLLCCLLLYGVRSQVPAQIRVVQICPQECYVLREGDIQSILPEQVSLLRETGNAPDRNNYRFRPSLL